MDTALNQFGSLWLSLYSRGQVQQSRQLYSRSPDSNPSEVAWIIGVAEFSRSGFLQSVILVASATWLSYSLLRLPVITLDFKSWLYTKGWIYELLSYTSRATALLLLAFAYAEGQVHFPTLVVVAYAQILGLFRLADDVHWRHSGLHQLNFVTTAILLVLATAHILPCVQISSSQCTTDAGILGGISSLAVAIIVASITPREWVPSNIDLEIGTHTTKRAPAPEETCSWFNYYCTYGWFTPLIWKGVTNKLDMNSIPALAWYDEPMYLLRKIQSARAISMTTFWTVLRFQRKELIFMTLWIAASACLENVAPFAMFQLLKHIANPMAATYHPEVWLVLLFIGPITRSVSFQQYLFISTRFIVRVKSAMTQELYHKALDSMELEERIFSTDKNNSNGATKQPKVAQKSSSTGRLANLMAADIDAIYRARDIIIAVVGVPIGTAISLGGLYKMMGWVSFVGIIIILLATPLSILLGRMMYRFQKRARQAQDTRISLITEYISSIRAIKFLAWEDAMTNKVDDARAIEQKGLWRVAILQTIINLITQAFPYIGLLVMFGLYVGMEKRRLDASTAFTAILLVKNIRRNARSVSANSRKFTGAIVAFKRLDKYFESTIPLARHPIGPLRIQNASFRRNKTNTSRLQDISLDFVVGKLNVVTGHSGSGKTTLLLSILGETHMESGSLVTPRDIAFASQSAWLQSGTIQDNIIFHTAKDKTRYDPVIKACCLDLDFKKMPSGDMTIIGENGTSLSGGQMARVALARALYSQSSLLLLDDIFSALDAKTSAEVWKHCFCSALLDKRTTILVTQIPWIISQANLAIELDKGRVKSVEANVGAMCRPITIAEHLETGDFGTKEAVTRESNAELSRNQPSGVADDNTAKEVVNQEMKASGKVGRLAFFQYIKNFGNPILIAACLFCSLLSNGSFFLSSYWMSIWVQAYEHKAHIDIAYYMSIYALFTFLGIVTVGATTITFEWGGWCAAHNLHNAFIRSVMSAPLSWSKAVPLGRVTNRFSRDMSSIDTSLSSMLRFTLGSILALLFRVAAVSSLLPILILPVLCASAIGIIVGEMYARTAVILRRLTSAANSPIFSHFVSTLAGLHVIRARDGMHEAFGEDLATKLRVWTAAAEANYNSNRWVALRVSLVTALISVLTGIIALSKVGVISAGLVGFSLLNAVRLSQSVMTLVRAVNDLDIEMQSFHRVKEYVEVQSEDKDDEPFVDEGGFDEQHCLVHGRDVIPNEWPRSGEIEFRNVTVRYEDGPNILTDINLKFKAGERVAIIGRTGSGKTTLILSLLRFTNIVSGQILYDGIDITKTSRRRLRQSVTIIPQEPTLFSGSVRSNLDPAGFVPGDIISRVFNSCKDIASLSGNKSSDQDIGHEPGQGIFLSTEVDGRGENFSHAQRQVLSLCRALIRKSKLMLLDEATASMDYQADQDAQKVLRRELDMTGDTTLVTVAHRLRTIVDYNTIVVMDAGRVIECGSPRDLYDARGQFHDLVYHSGESAELQEMLKEK
ncbi:hypothetical protein V500_04961 [Pseudogymnoascus sp. VKM F-4518 (FW-2643)]|nr:hypothetical protein V500_04961 [Pseudogymnoascus sp. VKM F-4518 (FW-2643)]